MFPQNGLKTCSGDTISVLSPGHLNSNAGPDFYDSKIKINDTLWVGTVEIHIQASDWNRHQHQQDQSYDNVILHVVWQKDKEVYRTDGTLIPALELENIIPRQLLDKIADLRNNEHWIPCQEDLPKVDEFTKRNWLDRMVIERLIDKTTAIKQIYDDTKGSWEDTFYILMSSNFGFKVNQQPFEMLAKNLSQQILAKHKDNPKQIEALIFGMSGLLASDFEDEYPKHLKDEFTFLKQKYGLRPLDPFIWKFAKTRPDNFPTIRLAQFAALVYKSSHLFSKLLEKESVKEYKDLFEGLAFNTYWNTHYLFDKEKKVPQKMNLGERSIDNLLINSVAPMLFFYGDYMDKQLFKDKAVALLESIKAEENLIIKGFRDLGFKAAVSSESQGLIHLRNFYCNQKKCLNCAIGIKILQQ